mmetsp:Transcript_37175/g.111320  ORF Transcript_37175/g.111320 Transcript_37175/m.111320 type:complete len:231 (-) Transcript_37175:176-868(-)
MTRAARGRGSCCPSSTVCAIYDLWRQEFPFGGNGMRNHWSPRFDSTRMAVGTTSTEADGAVEVDLPMLSSGASLTTASAKITPSSPLVMILPPLPLHPCPTPPPYWLIWQRTESLIYKIVSIVFRHHPASALVVSRTSGHRNTKFHSAEFHGRFAEAVCLIVRMDGENCRRHCCRKRGRPMPFGGASNDCASSSKSKSRAPSKKRLRCRWRHIFHRSVACRLFFFPFFLP